jgi:hypothetical protein
VTRRRLLVIGAPAVAIALLFAAVAAWTLRSGDTDAGLPEREPDFLGEAELLADGYLRDEIDIRDWHEFEEGVAENDPLLDHTLIGTATGLHVDDTGNGFWIAYWAHEDHFGRVLLPTGTFKGVF